MSKEALLTELKGLRETADALFKEWIIEGKAEAHQLFNEVMIEINAVKAKIQNKDKK